MKNEVKTRRAGILYRMHNVRIVNKGGYNYGLYVPLKKFLHYETENKLSFYPNGEVCAWRLLPGTFRMKEIRSFVKSKIMREYYASQNA